MGVIAEEGGASLDGALAAWPEVSGRAGLRAPLRRRPPRRPRCGKPAGLGVGVSVAGRNSMRWRRVTSWTASADGETPKRERSRKNASRPGGAASHTISSAPVPVLRKPCQAPRGTGSIAPGTTVKLCSFSVARPCPLWTNSTASCSSSRCTGISAWGSSVWVPAANAAPVTPGSTVMTTSPAAGGPSFNTSPFCIDRAGFMNKLPSWNHSSVYTSHSGPGSDPKESGRTTVSGSDPGSIAVC